MQKTYPLLPFASSPQTSLFSLTGSLSPNASTLSLGFTLQGPLSQLLVPHSPKSGKRQEGLYNHTCFEFFLLGENGRYFEWNFAPNGDWCTFSFESYRQPASRSIGAETFSNLEAHALSEELKLSVDLDLKELEKTLASVKGLRFQLSTVLELKSGELSYWTIRHGKSKPDFHALENFTAL